MNFNWNLKDEQHSAWKISRVKVITPNLKLGFNIPEKEVF